MSHTPEPWKWEPGEVTEDGKCLEGTLGSFVGANNQRICDFGVSMTYYPSQGSEPTPADRRRIVAAVNACAGISTEALESGVVQEMLDALKKATRFVVNSPERDAARVYFEMFAAIAKAKGQQPPDTSTPKGE